MLNKPISTRDNCLLGDLPTDGLLTSSVGSGYTRSRTFQRQSPCLQHSLCATRRIARGLGFSSVGCQCRCCSPLNVRQTPGRETAAAVLLSPCHGALFGGVSVLTSEDMGRGGIITWKSGSQDSQEGIGRQAGSATPGGGGVRERCEASGAEPSSVMCCTG